MSSVTERKSQNTSTPTALNPRIRSTPETETPETETPETETAVGVPLPSRESLPTKPNLTPSDRSATSKSQLPFRSIIAVAMVALIGIAVFRYFNTDTYTETLVFHTVARQDLLIDVVERGNLESQNNVPIICEVDDVERDGMHGNPILWVIDNGASVEKGDLLVEIDGTNHLKMVDSQILEVEEEQADFIQAQVQFNNQTNQNLTRLQQAKLQVELAQLAVNQFEDEKGGTFQIELQGVELELQEAEAGQLIEKTNLDGVEQLFKLGYRSSGELAQARLNALRSQRQLATALSKKRELVQYSYKKSKLELQGALATARQDLKQVELDNEAELRQAEALMVSAEEQLKKERELLERYKSQLEMCKIYAPQSGMVAYFLGNHRYHREEVRPGAAVRPKQTIMTIPDLNRMQVQTSIHESALDQVKPGMKATVRVDAVANQHYTGSVQSVAVLPDQGGWSGSDTKVYPTVVRIDEEVKFLKPGMTAVVEIHVDRLVNVVSIPIQAIVQQGGDTFCYVQSGRGVDRRIIEAGATNDKYVEIKSGLEPGEKVVLNPATVDVANAKNKADTPGSVEAEDSPTPEPLPETTDVPNDTVPNDTVTSDTATNEKTP